MLSAFVIAQLVFDVAVVAFAVVYLLTRESPRAPEPIQPPEWYGHFLKVAQDLMVATEPVLDRLESRAPPVPTPLAPSMAPMTATATVVPVPAAADPYFEARRLLRAGVGHEEVADRAGLQPAELRLLAKVVAAESRRRSG
jgi:hypothetical protein